jgi:hypothetical protein
MCACIMGHGLSSQIQVSSGNVLQQVFPTSINVQLTASYPLNINSQDIVQSAAARRAVTTTDVLKMTQAEDGDCSFAELYTARTVNSRV